MQPNLNLIRCFMQKKIWPILFWPTFFLTQIFFRPTNFWPKFYCDQQKILQKFFFTKNIFDQNFFWPNFFFTQILIHAKKCWPKKFQSQFFLAKTNFRTIRNWPYFSWILNLESGNLDLGLRIWGLGSVTWNWDWGSGT